MTAARAHNAPLASDNKRLWPRLLSENGLSYLSSELAPASGLGSTT
jgi:hypothetical protein